MVCDQCARKHKKCSREVPICAQCSRLGIACTRSRKKILQTQDRIETVSMTINQPQYFVQRNSKKEVRYKKNIEKFILNSPDEYHIDGKSKEKDNRNGLVVVSRMQPRALEVVSDWSQILGKWTGTLDLKIVFNIFLKCCGLNTSRLTKKDELFLCNIFTKKIEPVSPYPVMPLQLCYSQDDTVHFNQVGIQAYFFYFNPFWPQFTFRQFKRRPRSHLLSLAISTAGLTLLPRSSIRDSIIKKNSAKLSEEFVPSKLVFSLDTVQAIFTYFTFQLGSNGFSKAGCLLKIAQSILVTLGSRKKNSIHFKEILQARHFMANLETNNFLNDIFPCNDFYLKSPKLALKVHKTEFNINFSIEDWVTTLQLPIYKIPRDCLYDSTEEIIHFILSERRNRINILFRSFLSALPHYRSRSIPDLFKFTSLTEYRIDQEYCEAVKDVYKVVEIVTSFNRNHFMQQYREAFLFEIIDKIALMPKLHMFKIQTCYIYLQILDTLSSCHLITALSCHPDFFYLSKRALLYSTHLVHLIHQINLDSPLIMFRTRLILIAIRITIYFTKFLESRYQDPRLFNYCWEKVNLATQILDLLTQKQSIGISKTYKKMVDSFALKFNF